MKFIIGRCYKTIYGDGECIDYSNRFNTYSFYYPFVQETELVDENQIFEQIEDLPTYKYLYDFWMENKK